MKDGCHICLRAWGPNWKFRQADLLHHIRKAKAVKPSLLYYQLEFGGDAPAGNSCLVQCVSLLPWPARYRYFFLTAFIFCSIQRSISKGGVIGGKPNNSFWNRRTIDVCSSSGWNSIRYWVFIICTMRCAVPNILRRLEIHPDFLNTFPIFFCYMSYNQSFSFQNHLFTWNREYL